MILYVPIYRDLFTPDELWEYEIEVEVECAPGDGDGWNEPRYGPSARVVGATNDVGQAVCLSLAEVDKAERAASERAAEVFNRYG